MELLTVAARLDGIHHDVLRRHKGQLAPQSLLDYLRVNNQSVHHIQAEIKDSVDRQKSLGDRQSLVRGIVQRSLKPLRCGGDRRIQGIDHHISRQGSDSLAPHRVSLICHRRRTDLALLKRLLHLLQMLKQTDVVAHLMGGCGDSRQHIRHSCINLSGIGLSGYRETFLKSHLLSDHGIDLVNRLLIPVKQLQKRSLRSRCSLRSKELHGAEHIVQILIVQIKFLQPECRALSHGCRLCRLEMRECQRRLRLIFLSEIRQLRHNVYQLLFHKLQCLCHDNNIGIVTHIAGGRTEVDDASRLRALFSVCVHMAHDVVAHFLLSRLCDIIVDILRMRLQLLDLLVCNDRLSVLGQSQFLLRLRKGNPELAPRAELHVRGKNVLHLLTCIAFRKGAFISVCTHNFISFCTIYVLSLIFAADVLRRRIKRVFSCKAALADPQSLHDLLQPLHIEVGKAVRSDHLADVLH